MNGPLITLREVQDNDGLDVIELIGSVFGEYRGCILDVDGEMPELRALRSTFLSQGGMFWVAEAAARVVGCVGYVPSAPREIELKKLYVHRHFRRSGLGQALLGKVTERATESASAIVLFSDTKFETAHRFYERAGFVRLPGTRALGDKSATIEFGFRRDAGEE